MTQGIRSRVWLHALYAGAIALWLGACSSGGGRSGSPTAPPPPPMNPGSASFQLAGAGYDEVVSYSSGSNLVLCTQDAGFADLFIRFAEQVAGNGENGPHLDIDLCNHGASGTFAARDPQVPSCDDGQTWGVFWHDAGATFLNQADAPSCSLVLTRSGSALSGTFSCPDLVELGGTRSLDVLAGSFQCTEQ